MKKLIVFGFCPFVISPGVLMAVTVGMKGSKPNNTLNSKTLIHLHFTY